jgi:hypothetical protein
MTNTATPVGGTEQSVLVTVEVDGQSLGVWDTATGGDSLASSAQYRAGGQKNMTSYRTLPKFSELTVSRVCDLSVDWELIRKIKTLAGGVPGSVTEQPLDADQNPYGNSQTAVGMFLGVTQPKADSNSEALQMYELHFSVDQWQ